MSSHDPLLCDHRTLSAAASELASWLLNLMSLTDQLCPGPLPRRFINCIFRCPDIETETERQDYFSDETPREKRVVRTQAPPINFVAAAPHARL